MKKYILSIAFLSSLFFINACEDPIDVELSDAPAIITVDAWLNNRPEPQVIRLTESQPYFENSFVKGINNATVTVRRDDGEVFEFVSDGEGNYIWTPFAEDVIGVVGNEYSLSIDANGESLSSVATMHRVPEIESIEYEFRDDFIEDGIYAEFIARDFVGVGDTYWIKTYKNGEYLNLPEEINIAFDAGFDSGSPVDGLIFIPPVRFLTNPAIEADPSDTIQVSPYDPGDMIKVEIHSINNAAFDFMETTRDQLINGSNGIFAEPLVNSRGNVTNNTTNGTVLGVFNVAAITEAVETVN